jgi:hypothetical protein
MRLTVPNGRRCEKVHATWQIVNRPTPDAGFRHPTPVGNGGVASDFAIISYEEEDFCTMNRRSIKSVGYEVRNQARNGPLSTHGGRSLQSLAMPAHVLLRR